MRYAAVAGGGAPSFSAMPSSWCHHLGMGGMRWSRHLSVLGGEEAAVARTS